MSCLVSVVLLTSGLSILLTGYGDSGLHVLAGSWIGSVVGYWLD